MPEIETACCAVPLALAAEACDCGSDCDCACRSREAVDEAARTTVDWGCC